MCIVRTAVMVCAVLGLVALPITIAEARQAKHKSAGAEEARPAGRNVEASLDKARHALDEGKPQTAKQLTDAILVSEKTDTHGMARALAIRGEAYVQLGRPAEAISDLDSALWLKGGLAGRERELASAARARAMQTAGGPAGGAPVANAHPSSHAAPAGRASQPQAWTNTVTAASDAPAAKGSSGSGNSSGGGISGFFSNLFGGGQSTSPAPETTGAVNASPPRKPAVSSSAPQRVGGEPSVSRSTPPVSTPRRATAAVAPHRSARQSRSTSAEDGNYALQLAAVRTRAEAQAMAQKVRAEKGRLLRSHKVEIIENVYGNMGRFYRVKIGPFAKAEKARSICESLRTHQLDCMVVDPHAG
jgi:cell division septation protein DedD